MSGKSSYSTQKIDRRVQRTRDALGNALITLLQEKTYDAITIQDLLNLAGISRSTFYTHFRDKNDLFISYADDFFYNMANLLNRRVEASQRVAPVKEMVNHLINISKAHNAVKTSSKHPVAMEIAREHFARGIEQRLAMLSPIHANASAARAALSYSLAGAMFSLIHWWMDRGQSTSSAQIDDLFHQIVWAGASEAFNS